MKVSNKIFIIALLLSLVFSIGAVAAADNITFEQSNMGEVSSETNFVTPDYNQDLDSNADSTLKLLGSSKVDDVENDLIDENDSKLLSSSNNEKLGSYFYGSTFSELQQEIDNAYDGDIIYLTGDVINDGNSPINITKSISIYGRGYSIDANGASGIFKLQDGVWDDEYYWYNEPKDIFIYFNNIVFKNSLNDAIVGYLDYYYYDNTLSQVDFYNCEFRNNSGRVISISGANMTISKSTFVNNTQSRSNTGSYLVSIYNGQAYISDSTFLANKRIARSSGGGSGYFGPSHEMVWNFGLTSDSYFYFDNSYGPDYGSQITFNNVVIHDAMGGQVFNGQFDNPYNWALKVPIYNNVLEVIDSEGNVVDTFNYTDGSFKYMPGGRVPAGEYTLKFYHPEDEYHTYGEFIWDRMTVHGDFYELDLMIRFCIRDGIPLNLTRNYTYSIGYDTITEGIPIDGNLTIIGNGYTINALNQSRIFNIQSGNVVIKDVNFVNGISSAEGGAIYWEADDGIIVNSNFTDNHADKGAAIFWAGNGGTANNCNFINNSATNFGGAIYADGSDISLSNSNFINNSAFNGGAIYMFGADSKLDNCNFTDNNGTWGGAVYWNADRGTLINSNFTDNSANYGGAVLWSGANGVLKNTLFTNNQGKYGGAVSWSGIDGDLSQCEFFNNSAYGSAGAIYVTGRDFTLSNSHFDNNHAPEGGAVCFDGRSGTLKDSTFKDNSADYGGAVYWSNSDGQLDNCNFENNYGQKYGGAVYWEGADGILTNSIFKHNNALSAAGVYWHGPKGILSNSTFEHNNAESDGGAVYAIGEDFSIYNTIFNKNIAERFGGALFLGSHLSTSQPVISSATFTENKAKKGSAIYMGNKDTVYILDSTFLENRADSEELILTVNVEDDKVNISSTLIGGDNLLNGMYYSDNNVILKNVTYFGIDGTMCTGGDELSPVVGADLSNNGQLPYKDSREANQPITIEIHNKKDGIIEAITDFSDIYGNVYLNVEDLDMGEYTVVSYFKENRYYTDIETTKTFTITPPKVDLVVIKTANITEAHIGDLIEWTINITNYGPGIAYGVNVTEYFPSSLSLISAHPDVGEFKNNIWMIEDLISGESQILKVITQVVESGDIYNKVSVDTDSNNTNPDKNFTNDIPVHVNKESDLEIIKIANVTSAHVGDLIEWTITVVNHGPDTAYDVFVVDNLPDSLEYVSHIDNEGVFDKNTNIWDVGDIANGESATLKLITKVVLSDTTIINSAIVNTTNHDPNDENNNGSNINNTIDSGSVADLEVIKVANVTEVKVGDLIEWTITVTNHGPDTAFDVEVVDKLPDSLEFVSFETHKGIFNRTTDVWSIGDMNDGDVAVLKLITRVTLSNVNIINSAIASSSSYDPNETNNNGSNINQTVESVPVADLEIIKVANVTDVKVGDLIEWTITVINHGPDEADDVFVVENLPDSLEYVSHVDDEGIFDKNTMIWDIGNIANGKHAILKLVTRVVATDVSIINSAVVNSTTYDPNETNNNGSNIDSNQTIESEPEADLEVIKVANITEARIGDLIEWTITVINHGPDAAKDVSVIENLPQTLKFVSYFTHTGTFDEDTLVWTIGDMENGKSVVLTLITEVVMSNVEIVNSAVVNSSTYDPNNTNNNGSNINQTIVSDPVADLEVIKVANCTDVREGDLIEWTITVINHGPDMAQNVKVVENLPESLTLVTYYTEDGIFNKNTKVWSIGNMLNGDIVVLTLITRVTMSNVAIVNSAVVNSSTYDPNNTNNNGSNIDSNQTIESEPEADLEIIKVANETDVKVGDLIEWTITVVNHGPDKASDVAVVENLPDSLELVDYFTKDGTFNHNTLIWTIGDMENGESVVLTLITRVTMSNVAIVNSAVVNSSTYDPNETNNNGSNIDSNQTIESGLEADLEIIKVANVTEAHIGDLIEWTITVINHGPDEADDVFVVENLPDSLEYVSHVDDEGIFDKNTMVWTIGNIANGESAVLKLVTRVVLSNVAIVNSAVVNSSTYDPNDDNNNGSNIDNKIESDSVADLEVIKVANATSVKVGDLIEWTITVINHGPDMARDVKVAENLPESLALVTYYTADGIFNKNTLVWSIGNIENGATVVLTLITRVTMSHVDIVNSAVASSSTYDPNTTNNNGSNINNTVESEPITDLSINQTTDNATYNVGDEIIVTIVVSNDYEHMAHNVTVKVEFDESLKVISADKDFNNGIWVIGNLDKDKTIALVLTLKATKEGTYTIVSNVSSTVMDTNEDNNIATSTIIVSKVSAYPVDITTNVTPDGNVTIEVTVPEDATGNVTVTIGNETYTAPIENGTAVINVTDVTPGDYTVDVNITGDDKYDGTTEPVSFKVNSIGTVIIVERDFTRISTDFNAGER